MEIKEQIAVDATALGNEECWFCKKKTKDQELTNDEAADPDTSDSEEDSAIPENNEDNDSSKLGKSLIKDGYDEPSWSIDNPLKPGNPSRVVPAAHHCIPGEASLAKASGLHSFMRKGDNYTSDIGYNVNHSKNGVWLPGNYAVRDDNEEFDKKTWTDHGKPFQKNYVRLAMEKASGRMFHDAHPAYNRKVLGTLNSIAGKLDKPNKENCPICDKPLNDGKSRPPFGLVGRLDFVSGEHRGMLVAPTPATVSEGYFTSSKGRDVVNTPPTQT